MPNGPASSVSLPDVETDNASVPVADWERRTEWPLAVLAVLFLVAYALPILDQHLPSGVRAVCRVANVVIWAAFAADFAARLIIARRWRYFWTHLHDLAMVALPLLRPLRLLRLLMLLRMLNRRAADSLRGRVIVYVAGSAVLLVACAALAALDAERGHHGANIETIGDAVWWSIATVCTVGYGDRYPVTAEGRAVATGLMLGGIALLGVVTATLASWLIDRVREVAEDEQAATRADVHTLSTQVAQLRHANIATSLADLATLRRDGLLDEQEFTLAKRKLLS